MDLLLPIITAVLVILGSVCLFISIENDRRVREFRSNGLTSRRMRESDDPSKRSNESFA
ncbi:hypothetical protein SAMN04487970_100476 [Paenibacillus tianmuensis]|uniref:Uncharacterized protein n=1 Tax=Paenibacillus tianmuensis TaxID=624147 RepID=A0A1G4PVA9_9BACL|nr:hypothetical protein [Paenibacillus tianmuensis]SCW36222.1 hypothetical protein SAMN04487970_100476 [Paenibacillus tianmuensis]